MAVSDTPGRPVATRSAAPVPAQRLSKRDAKKHERNLTRAQAHAASERARADLVLTLSALEEQLNFPKRISRATRRVSADLQRFAREQPGAVAAIGAAVVVVIAGTVYLVVRANND